MVLDVDSRHHSEAAPANTASLLPALCRRSLDPLNQPVSKRASIPTTECCLPPIPIFPKHVSNASPPQCVKGAAN